MSTTVSLNGTSYAIPATGENSWGDVVANYLIALGSGVLQKAGGSFTLTAEVDFGATYGLKSTYYKSRATNPASAGSVRLGNLEYIKWRNAANGADLGLTVNASDVLEFNSLPISAIALGTANRVLGMNNAATAQEYKTVTGTSNQVTVTHGANTITLSTPQDIAAASSPTFVGVTLSGLTASKVMVTDGSKLTASSAVTSTELGYLSGVTTPTGSGALVLATSPTLVTPVIGAATGVSLQLSGLTASKVMVTDASKNLASSAVTGTELGYLSGVTTPTGSGALVLATTPTLVTPVLGVATATSINKVAITTPATSATLTIANGKTLTASNTLTLTGTDASSVAFGAGGTVAYTANDLSVFASTTSLQLKTLLSDETGSGSAVFATTPTLTTPNIATSMAMTAAAELRYYNAGGTFYTGFKGGNAAANKIWTLPLVDGSSGQALKTDGSGTLIFGAVAGSGGSINYISESDFEDNLTAGWATYADASAVTPVDGTGGSPNSTFATNSSSPLRGTYDAVFTKGAANRQGEGFSYPFTIAAADKSLPLVISWEGLASANYTGSSGTEYMSVYVYDVTNATLISPASTIVAQGSSKGKSFFVATTSTSYRLIFHVAGTGTSAWTYNIDTVSVGPQPLTLGFAGTDWQSYAPTTAGLGTPTTNTAWYRRVGDSIEVQGFIEAGTVTASTLKIGLPTGLTIDSTKTAGNLKNAWGILSTTGGGSALGVFSNTGTSLVAMYDSTDNASAFFASQVGTDASGNTFNALLAANSVMNNSAQMSYWFRFPISTLTSNVTLADRAVSEYASNSDTSSTASVTASGFQNGPAGQAFSANFVQGTTWIRRIRFQGNVQKTDNVFLEIADSNYNWSQTSDAISMGLHRQGASSYGMWLTPVSGSSTDYDVYMGAGGRIGNNATYAGAGSAFSGQTTYYWRVSRVSGGASVGYPVSSQNIVGRTDGVAPSAGYVGQMLESIQTSAQNMGSSGTYINVTSLAITAGTWLVTGLASLSASTGATSASVSISSTSITPTTEGNTDFSGLSPSLSVNAATSVTKYVTLSATTTHYLVAQTNYSGGTPSWKGTIRAVRIA